MSKSFRRTSIWTEGDEELIIFHDIHPHCLTTKYDIIFAVWSLLTSFSCWFKFWLSVKSFNSFLDIMVLTLFRWEHLREEKGHWNLFVSNSWFDPKHSSFDSWSQSKRKPLPSPHLEIATTVFFSHCFGKPNFLFPPGIYLFSFLTPWKIIYPIAI